MATPETPTPKTTVAEAIQLRSAKPLEKMTPEEKRRRLNELRTKMNTSKLAVYGKPGIHYLWASHGHKGDETEMVRLEHMGYSITREPKAKAVLAGEAKPQIQANGLREDGTYVMGDVILTQCDQEIYDMICLINSERQEELATGAQSGFLMEAEKNAVPVFDHIK